MLLSVLIRNLNESETLNQTLLALKKQEVNFEYEIIVIDNESDDDSVAVAEKAGCKVFTLKRNEFSFGGALNFGIAKCSGEIILILSAHVILLNEFFLQKIPSYFKDEKVAGLRFVQVTAEENISEIIANGPVLLHFSDEPDFAAVNWKNLPVNHCAAIKKSTWQEINFDNKIFAGEDKLWSLEILKREYTILYHIPCFYVYTKPFSREIKIKRAVIEEAAKESITGKPSSYSSPGFLSVKKIRENLHRMFSDLRMHTHIYKGIKNYRDKK